MANYRAAHNNRVQPGRPKEPCAAWLP